MDSESEDWSTLTDLLSLTFLKSKQTRQATKAILIPLLLRRNGKESVCMCVKGDLVG